MAAYDYNVPADIVDINSIVILAAGDYRIQDSQITLMDGQEIHITLTRINKSTLKISGLTLVVHGSDLTAMSSTVTQGKAFSDELDTLIWGWIFARNAALVLIGREALVDELLPTATKV